MQPNSEKNTGQPKTPVFNKHATSNSDQDPNLSLTDFLPDVFEGAYAPLVSNNTSTNKLARDHPKARNWVAANFDQTKPKKNSRRNKSMSANKNERVLTRVQKNIPIVNKQKPGPWLIMSGVFVLVISILLVLGWLYYNNILGAVPPSNGPLESYPGADRLEINQKSSNYIFEIEKDLPQIAGAVGVPSITSDNASQVIEFYNHSMAGKGYVAVPAQKFGINPSNTTFFGPRATLYFSRNKQIARVEVITMTSDITDLNIKKGQVLLILASGRG